MNALYSVSLIQRGQHKRKMFKLETKSKYPIQTHCKVRKTLDTILLYVKKKNNRISCFKLHLELSFEKCKYPDRILKSILCLLLSMM